MVYTKKDSGINRLQGWTNQAISDNYIRDKSEELGKPVTAQDIRLTVVKNELTWSALTFEEAELALKQAKGFFKNEYLDALRTLRKQKVE